MSRVPRCAICISPHRGLIEEARDKGVSYSQIAEDIYQKFGDRLYARTFTTHFNKHLPIARRNFDFDELKRQLEDEMASAPPTIAGLYAIALHNMQGLEATKPSQEHFIKALRSIHEISGMQLKHQLLLSFAAARARKVGTELAPGKIIDADAVDTRADAAPVVPPLPLRAVE